MRRRTAPLIAALLVLLASAASASTVRYVSDAAIIGQSDRVVHGRVIAQRTTRDGSSRAIYTVTTLAVIEDLTGVDSTTVDVWELGGTVGRDALYVGGAVRFEVGSEVVVCLRRGRAGPSRDRHGPVGVRCRRRRRWPAAADAADSGHAGAGRTAASFQSQARRVP